MTRALPRHRFDRIDYALVALFLVGIYLDIAIWLPGGIPVPAIIAGLAAGLMLLRSIRLIQERHLLALAAVVVLYLASTMAAPDFKFLSERFKGIVQISYSLLLAYAFFLTATKLPRGTLARLFLGFSLVLLVGALLENFTPLATISDTFRGYVFKSGVYDADVRDQMLYGRIRPKFFTSEPSLLTFGYTLFAFAWYALSAARFKLVAFLCLIVAGYWVMRGPALMLGVALLPVYQFFLVRRFGSPGRPRPDMPRVVAMLAATAVVVAAILFAGSVLYAERIDAILSGQDASFFGRIVAPILTAQAVILEHPFAGAGLTGWEFIGPLVEKIYTNASGMAVNYYFDGAANAVTNYFWLHWIYLGLFWGSVLLIAHSALLRSVGTPSLLFAWAMWAVMGQSVGAYVAPRTWFVLFLAAAIAVVVERERGVRRAPARTRAHPEAGIYGPMPTKVPS